MSDRNRSMAATCGRSFARPMWTFQSLTAWTDCTWNPATATTSRRQLVIDVLGALDHPMEDESAAPNHPEAVGGDGDIGQDSQDLFFAQHQSYLRF